jgi:ATP-dependent DNA helicase RecQ
MSRARETLQLFAMDHADNPHVELLHGDFLMDRKVAPSRKPPKHILRYELLGMKDLYIDFAAMKKENHPTCKAIKELTTGSRLTIRERNGSLDLVNHEQIPVARLSKSARARWRDCLETIRDITVIALARRCRTDIKDQEFQARCRSESWEVPVVELRYL